MEHRGVQYRIIQGIKRGLWKWSVETETGTKSGTSDSKDAAVIAAKRTIDNALNPKKQKLIARRGNLCLLKTPKGQESLEIFVPPSYCRGHGHNSFRARFPVLVPYSLPRLTGA